MSKIALYVSATAVFIDDGTGSGGTIARAQLSPSIFGVTWHVTKTITSTTSQILIPQFQMFQNFEQPSALIDSTFNGNQDTSDTVFDLDSMDIIKFLWINGDLGTIATAILTGDVETGRM